MNRAVVRACGIVFSIALGGVGTEAAAQAAGAAQNQPPAAAAPDDAARLTPVVNVNGNVHVEAVLLPPRVTRDVFGKAVADRYAAVQMIVSNRSRDAALIVHSVFIDYSRWLFSGTASQPLPRCAVAGEAAPLPPAAALAPPAAAAPTPPPSGKVPECENPVQPWEAANQGSQIASAEYRVPRATLLESQASSPRNLTVRIAEMVGTVATGLVFTMSDKGAKYVSAYNGALLPGLRAAWPDDTIDQINRLSDLGFRVNKVIPKESSDVLVAFFPIDRFLTPGVKAVFDQSPAMFFVPHAVLFDAKAKDALLRLFDGNRDQQKALADAIAAVQGTLLQKGAPDASSPAMELLNKISLSNIRLIVSGVMSVDVDAVPASISGIDIGDADRLAFWSVPGTKTAAIRGRYLAGGKVTIANADRLQIADIRTIADGSTDTTLRFSFTLNNAIPDATMLSVRVDKSRDGGAATEGIPYDYPVSVPTAVPAIKSVARQGNVVTITGSQFVSTAANPLTIELAPGGVAGAATRMLSAADATVRVAPEQITIDVAPLALEPACWTPRVKVSSATAAGDPFVQPPAPRIAKAARSGSTITLNGTGFLDLAACSAPLTVQVSDQARDEFEDAKIGPAGTPTRITFAVPDDLRSAMKLKVRVKVGDAQSDPANVE
jgi:hypothetical protein